MIHQDETAALAGRTLGVRRRRCVCGDAARLGDTHRAYTLTEAYNAGLITADDLASNGCAPAGYDAITCAPNDLPWCPEHPPGNPGLLTRAMLDGVLVKVSDSTECQVNPADLMVLIGVHLGGPPQRWTAFSLTHYLSAA
jgi:hypothetical protein